MITPRVITRLADLDIQANDVTFAVERAKTEILAKTNREEIPEALIPVWVDMAVGYYLQQAKAFGGISANGADYSGVTSISEGDVSISFGSSSGSSTAAATLEGMIDRMIHPPESVFARWRRVIW